nr:hypothetical protein [Veillonella seminalis]
MNPDGNTLIGGDCFISDRDRFITQRPSHITDGNIAVTAVTAVPLVSSRQRGAADGDTVVGFREGTVAECHGVFTECPVVIDVGPFGVAYRSRQIITIRFSVVRTYRKIFESESVLFQFLADFIRNVIIVENTIRNRLRKTRRPILRFRTGDFSAVGNLVKQILGNFVLDFVFFLLCQSLYICRASRQKRRHDKDGKQAVFDA